MNFLFAILLSVTPVFAISTDSTTARTGCAGVNWDPNQPCREDLDTDPKMSEGRFDRSETKCRKEDGCTNASYGSSVIGGQTLHDSSLTSGPIDDTSGSSAGETKEGHH